MTRLGKTERAEQDFGGGGGGELGGIAQRSIRTFHPVAPGLILGIAKNFCDKLRLKEFILDVAEIKRRHFLECGKLEHVVQTI